MAVESNPVSVFGTDSFGSSVCFFRRRLRNSSTPPERKKPTTAMAVPKIRRVTRSRVLGERIAVFSSGISGLYFTVMAVPIRWGDDIRPVRPV